MQSVLETVVNSVLNAESWEFYVAVFGTVFILGYALGKQILVFKRAAETSISD